MNLPIQAPPVTRPFAVEPHSVLDLSYGTPKQLLVVNVNYLLHGANFNDPAQWQVRSYDRMKTSSRG